MSCPLQQSWKSWSQRRRSSPRSSKSWSSRQRSLEPVSRASSSFMPKINQLTIFSLFLRTKWPEIFADRCCPEGKTENLGGRGEIIFCFHFQIYAGLKPSAPLDPQNKKREERLAVLREGGVLISEKELKKINTDFEKNKKFWRERKRKVTAIDPKMTPLVFCSTPNLE